VGQRTIDRHVEEGLDARKVDVRFRRRNLFQPHGLVVLQVHGFVLIQGFVPNQTDEVLQGRIVQPDRVNHEAGIRVDAPLRDELTE